MKRFAVTVVWEVEANTWADAITLALEAEGVDLQGCVLGTEVTHVQEAKKDGTGWLCVVGPYTQEGEGE